MSDWQERITRETPPAIWAEHELRYRLVAPLVATSSQWVDLGCGNGIAAAVAFGDDLPSRAVLVDLDSGAVSLAARELRAPDAVQIAGDLTNPELLDQIGNELTKAGGDRIITCFEVVEHLSTFVPLLEWSTGLARDRAATFVLSVPNDAFWSIENPFHAGRWGEGAFEELRRFLPREHTLLKQTSLVGSAMVAWGDRPELQTLTVDVGGDGAVATHFIAAFGPRHGELATGALAMSSEQLEQRRWERQRESNLAHAEALIEMQQRMISELETVVTERQAMISELQPMVAERDEWRAYIHELERALGRPLSGVEASSDQP